MPKRKKPASTVTFYPSFQALADAAHAMAIQKQTDDDHDDDNPAPEPADLGLRSAADYPRQPIEWLWPQKIPLGKVTLLIGDPGLGKSLIALDVASRVTTGGNWPAEAGSMEQGARSESNPEPHPLTPGSYPHSRSSMLLAPSSVLILTAEDEIADTIRPRLDAHGADPAKIFFASKLTDLRRDREKLAAILDRIPDCRLIVVDPVNAFVGPSDSHFHTVVRKVLAPLAELAAERRIAILAVTHLRKNTGRVIQSAAGSMGFVAAARTVWTVCQDPADATRNLLLPVKNNVGPLSPGLAYTIKTHPDLDAPIIDWQPEPIANTAQNIVQPAAKHRGPEAEDRRNAGEWLKLALAVGPLESFHVLREGKQNGFSERTLQRALHDIGGQTRKRGYYDCWLWSLPNSENESPAPTETDSVAGGRALVSPQISPATTQEPTDKQPTAEKHPIEKLDVFDETWRLRENPEKTGAEKLPDRPPSPTAPLSPIDCVEATITESIRVLTRLDAQRKPPAFTRNENHPPPTDHARLDQLLTNFRNSLRSLPRSTPPPPPPPLSTLNTQPSTILSPTAQKKVPGAIPVRIQEPTPGTLAQRTLANPERCISATFPPLCETSPTLGAAEMPVMSSHQHVSHARRNPTS